LDLVDHWTVIPSRPRAELTFPARIVEHVSNVLESPENCHIENVPHVRFGLLPETPERPSEINIVNLFSIPTGRCERRRVRHD
jgi:hypothetical protein